MKFIGLILLTLGIASAAYFLFFFDSSIHIPGTLYVPGGRNESEIFGLQQKNGTILSLATALLGGLGRRHREVLA